MDKKAGTTERGFTLIEMVIVLAVLSLLAAVVSLSALLVLGRGHSESYDSDLHTMQTAVATFYGDVHIGPDANVGGDAGDATDYRNNTWGDTNGFGGHYFPTATGLANGGAFNDPADNHAILIDTTRTNGDHGAALVYHDLDNDGAFDPGEEAADEVISSAAIWMGLLVNPAGSENPAGQNDRGLAAPHRGERSQYVMEFPASCTAAQGAPLEGNGRPGDAGTYTWIVGDSGNVYGVYRVAANEWYAGFSGSYP
jgi:prepilin-type N-terminal cleavage/methylation domain-containing protein